MMRMACNIDLGPLYDGEDVTVAEGLSSERALYETSHARIVLEPHQVALLTMSLVQYCVDRGLLLPELDLRLNRRRQAA